MGRAGAAAVSLRSGRARAGCSSSRVGAREATACCTTAARRCDLTLSATVGHQENEQSEVLMQSMLRAVGIDLAIRNYPANLLFAQNGPLYTGKYDLEWSIDTNGPDPDNAGNWNGGFIPPQRREHVLARRSDRQRDERGGRSAPSTRPNARRSTSAKRSALRELVPAVFFYWETATTALNAT